MKAITYYLQFPAGEKEDKDQNGNGRLPVLNGDSDEAGAQKIHKGLFKTASVVEKSSCPSLFSSEIKNSPSFVRTSTRRVRSKCKIQFKMTSDADNSNESVELDRHSIILQDKEDVSISQTTSIKTSVKELHDETGSLQTVSVGKQNLKKKKKLSLSSQKVSNCDTTNKSLCVKSEVLNEIFVESSRKTEDSLLFQGNGKSSLFVKCKLKDSLKEPKQHGFGTDVTNETCTDDKTSDKIPSRLNESNNAFRILMSSRIWQSPHEQGPDETKDHTYSNRKKTIVIADAPKKTVEIKENRKKRKKKLDVVRKRRIKKAKLSDTSSEIEIGAEKKPVVRSKKVVIVPESDSDGEGNTALGQSIDTLKSKAEDKQDHRGCGKMVVEETDDDYAEQSDEKELMKKDDKVVNQDSLMNSKLSTRTSRKMDGSKSRLSHKTSSKHILEEIKDNCSEPEQDHLHLKKLVVKVEKISPEKLIQISTQKCYEGSEKKVRKGRGKLVVGGKGTKEKGSEREDRMVNCQLSIHKAKMSPKLPKSTKKFVIQCNKSTGKSFFERRVKLVKKSEQESGEFGKKKSETWIEDTDSEEENQKQTEMNKKDKTNKAASVSTIDSNCEIPADPKKHIPFPEETKKRNSLFSYFNKVSKDEVLLKPEKIKVEVQIHSPPSSPSVKQRRTSVPEDKRKQIHCVKSKVLDMEDQIIVLESHITKPATDASSVFVVTPKKHNEINDMKTPPSGSGWKMRVRLRESPAQPVLDDTGDSSDDNIFIPKRKWVESKIPAQPIDAGEALQASRTGEKCMNSEGMESQDNDACVEGAEGEMEVIICSNPDRKPNDMKLAPLFLRKPKTDPAVVEARRNFLKSGVPDSVKKLADIQRSLEGQYQFLFPTVAHVQQQEDQLCVWNLPLVELPLNTTETEPPTLTLKQIEAVELGTFSNCCSTGPACSFTKPSTPTPITCFQKLLRILKSESPDFPIYRAFRRLHSKYLQGVEKSTEEVLGKDIKQQKRRGGKSRVTRSNAHIERQKEEICNRKSEVMWTEKYKPTSVDDLVGNRHSIDQLKHWLESWKHYSDEIQHRDKESGRNRKDSSSGDEFFDCDSNDNINRNLPNNTAILVGPHGCGKTSAVYAIANELGCKVLEINTSSKRNGKRILSELQEATQSHQVKSCSEHASGALGSFVKAKPTNSRKVKSKPTGDDSIPKEDGDDRKSSKMSIILVEGVDVVYDDQDEGFLSAVTSLVASSKRPVVLVTNDPHCPHLARFMDLHLVLKFRAPPSVRMSLWLQLVCLLEGVWIRHAAIGRLLDRNRGDVRQTMLQLQFWVLTGGNNLPRTVEIPNTAISENPVALQVPEIDVVDDHSNLSYISGDEADETPNDVPEHANCTETFTEYSEKYFQSCQLPFPLDLGLVWWNLASLISIPESLYQDRICIKSREVTGSKTLHEVKTESDDLDSVLKVSGCEVTEKETECVSMTVCEREMKDRISLLVEVGKRNSGESVFKRVHNDEDTKGNSISELLEERGVRKNCCSQAEADRMSRLMETMSAIDVMSSAGAGNREPCYRTWDQVPKDGTSLTEGAQCRWWENSVSRVLCHYLLEGNVHKCRTSLQKTEGCYVDVQVTKATFTKPTQQELWWRSVQHAADDTVLPAVPLWCRPDHHSVSCDYIPMLRTVCRYEQDRLACNTKRHSRFFHYLKGLNVHVSDATCSTLCAVFADTHTT